MEMLNHIGIVFIALGAIVGIILFSKIFKAMSSKRWPSVKGNLESTELRTVIFSGVIENRGLRDSAKAVVTNFAYTYSVDSQPYNGKRVTFSDFVNKTGGSLTKLQKKYEGQSDIDVYYNPKKPSDSVLIPGAGIYNFTPLITAALFIAAGIFMINFKG